jgi:hypothetical protein
MLRDNLAGLIEPMLSSAGTYSLALCTHPNESSDDRPQNALKIPARQGGIYTLPENVASPFHAEPAHERLTAGESFEPSHNNYDSLGHGICFRESNPLRGYQFASELNSKRRRLERP